MSIIVLCLKKEIVNEKEKKQINQNSFESNSLTKRKEYLESVFFFSSIVYNIDTYILHNTIHLKKLC